MKVDDLRGLAAAAQAKALDLPEALVREAILIRLVEQKLLDLCAAGKMNDTVHTCVGQEFSAVAVAGQLEAHDWITSNHRCHGHFIARTKNWRGLMDELMGAAGGVCKGVGSSQHLFAPGFLSNGPQAALVPVATGIALHRKINAAPGIAMSYIGEGTLGEGALYETMNLASLYQVPQLFVCENNFYSQSTPQAIGVAGSILARPQAFGIATFEADTWDPVNLLAVAREAIAHARGGRPAFLVIRTYRLNPHSKGDDNREKEELSFFRSHDRLAQLIAQPAWQGVVAELQSEIDAHVAQDKGAPLSLAEYAHDQLPRTVAQGFTPVTNDNKRMVQALNDAYRRTLEQGAFHIGEDVIDPYGGAFKVTRGLSTDFPDRVRSTPISEEGLTGVAIGMALMGTHSFAEIMFGDFITHCFDQVISNASKIHHMYAFQASAPVRIRTPMGGKRGYGPTHSQSLEKHLLGIDNVGVIALSSLLDPATVIEETRALPCPLIIIENKVDYGRYLWQPNEQLELERETKPFGALRLRPRAGKPTLTIASYGETARHLADSLELFFEETDFVPELICLTQLHPLDTTALVQSVRQTRAILVVEDGSVPFGVGAEVLAALAERALGLDFALRVGAEPVPIPSITRLELEILPSIGRILDQVKRHLSRKPS